MSVNKLQIEHLNQKLGQFKPMSNIERPSIGWIKAIRQTLGMSLEQLGKKLGINKSSVQRLEQREKNGTVTLKSLEGAANALDMKLVYAFVPRDGDLNTLIEKKAKQLATKIVQRTSGTMKLEGQENSPERIQKAIEERTQELMRELPKTLWD